MLFNSFEFLIFLPIVFLLYWFVFNRSLRLQNAFIVVVSYIFYGWWDWRFLILIAFTSLCSYYSGLKISELQKSPPHNYRAKYYAAASVVINLAILGVFKYFNFFSDNFERQFRLFGVELDWVTLDVLLPVGISFYTFQALSYTIDVYRGSIKPTHSVVDLFAYISFFPQLVAGPIERATNLLPQFYKTRQFDYAKAVDGSRQILWGLFKKMVIADRCAFAVNSIWANYEDQSGVVLIIGAILFTFQIYGDFSGYSDIAIGTARLFGINLMRNFNFPYFSRDIAEFWRRWHISLTTWFRDYIYIPLGGSREGKGKAFRNTVIIFLVSGFWHGANWTFIAWGAYHALLFAPLMLLGKNRKNTNVVAEGRILPTLKEALQMLSTFALVVIGWVIFRAENLSQAVGYIIRMFDVRQFSIAEILSHKVILALLCVFTLVEWLQRDKQHALQLPNKWLFRYSFIRFVFYVVMIFIILFFQGKQGDFIYFQF
ncbi:MAG: MBOAT family O-acyltransferase [Rikenellaceae bacterium]